MHNSGNSSPTIAKNAYGWWWQYDGDNSSTIRLEAHWFQVGSEKKAMWKLSKVVLYDSRWEEWCCGFETLNRRVKGHR
jgi:hypothetical protein